MATVSMELENALLKYIDQKNCGRALNNYFTSENKLKMLLQTTSVNSRYCLLMNVRGTNCNMHTGLHRGSVNNDLESLRYMLSGFNSDQIYDVLKIQTSYGSAPLHFAAFFGSSSIITYLTTCLSQQQKYNLLWMQDSDGDTALHKAASQKNLETVKVILSTLPSELQRHLLNMKNKKGLTATDIRAEILIGYSAVLSQGNNIILSI